MQQFPFLLVNVDITFISSSGKNCVLAIHSASCEWDNENNGEFDIASTPLPQGPGFESRLIDRLHSPRILWFSSVAAGECSVVRHSRIRQLASTSFWVRLSPTIQSFHAICNLSYWQCLYINQVYTRTAVPSSIFTYLLLKQNPSARSSSCHTHTL